uniref:GIY-YIG endonuclease n=2 Tax=Monilinia laxa TaxID=61186 RepID=A0A7L8EYG1_MONLA|nr:GIY-YIG endonuclease [Monilinia laxa]QOE17412.1 GIY-YIG endonuclease [Monilinia laxa]QYB19846.1 GIY-YIG endonuclease [Monilinia laxa]QYB19931.1 GIY-YIG endonuclease [Monilinia laxa]QYB20103.1 GIY-YIG endonuclease [Monilinia laxa]QYB20169.1 GIY-YIG endonuclease [Monilinia laxa]
MIILYEIKFLLLTNIYYIRINSIFITGKDTVHNLYYMYKLHFLALAYLLSDNAVGPLLEKFINNSKKPKHVLTPPYKAHLTITKKTFFKYRSRFFFISSASRAYYSSSKQSTIFPIDSSVTYENPLKSRHDICFNYRNFRGCYLWTSKSTGKQYIGSSINLSLILSEYFRESYLNLQSGRGSLICRALLKYGHEDFTLSIISLGPLDDKNIKYSSDNLPDFVVLEQSYLDKYKVEYNVNRVASSKYESLYISVNKGEANPSYNLLAEEAYAWNRNHSSELKILWSKSRGKNTYYLYSKNSFELDIVFFSTNKLADFFFTSVRVVKQMLELIESSEHSAIRCDDYIISNKPIESGVLANNIEILMNFDINKSKTCGIKLAADEKEIK